MKRNFIIIGLSAVIAFSAAFRASAFDLCFDAWAGNFGFTTYRGPINDSYPGDIYFWGGALYAIQPITDDIRFEGGFFIDPVLRNVTYGLLSYTESALTIGVGPFMGVFNDAGMPIKSGMSVALKIALPGILFASLISDATLGGDLQQNGDYLQERNRVEFGFYVKNAICTLGMTMEKFSQLLDGVRIVDALTSYSFRTDVFQKNVPYRLGILLSYQSLSKSYFYGAETTLNIVNSFVLGMRIDLLFSDSFMLYTNLDSNLFSFGQEHLAGGTTDSFLFRASTGFKINLDALSGYAKSF
jgi:hypothetical protein